MDAMKILTKCLAFTILILYAGKGLIHMFVDHYEF